ncbi:uncharacterized protein LOC123677191 [Harmonia axyridis]|uniref:uncharacterized protein LOC123677191 n=1 Tax=Harmonia axyridis TaxID=115357 RepID=UPI001E277929|nr:uncharacterized protein LOC123677191 [Harmonia axyridis]XP_045469720.1 uncharacterized protein LOC123677191 [Harmonia axyridis]
MSQLSKLMVVTEDEKERILKEHNITKKEFEDSVDVLRTWVSQHNNISNTEVINDNHLTTALINSKMSLENAKRAMEGYLTVKTLYSDFFEHMIPEEKKFKETFTLIKSVIMPKLLPNLSRLHVAKFMDPNGDAENGLDYYFTAIMIAELRMVYDFFLSTAMLLDLRYFGLKNLMKFTPTVNYKLVHMLTSVSLRIDTIHILNSPPIWDKIYIILKAILPSKILNKIKVHNSLEELQKDIPKEYLPSDYGGTEKSLDELHEMWKNEFEANEDLFKKLTKLRVKEVLRGPQFTDDTYMGLGIDGSFKKLDID